MTNNAVIVSGSPGFIGKHFTNKYPNTDRYCTLRNDNKIFFENDLKLNRVNEQLLELIK